jgi:hypothetical protein
MCGHPEAAHDDSDFDEHVDAAHSSTGDSSPLTPILMRKTNGETKMYFTCDE